MCSLLCSHSLFDYLEFFFTKCLLLAAGNNDSIKAIVTPFRLRGQRMFEVPQQLATWYRSDAFAPSWTTSVWSDDGKILNIQVRNGFWWLMWEVDGCWPSCARDGSRQTMGSGYSQVSASLLWGAPPTKVQCSVLVIIDVKLTWWHFLGFSQNCSITVSLGMLCLFLLVQQMKPSSMD